jgi:hypothetical protein
MDKQAELNRFFVFFFIFFAAINVNANETDYIKIDITNIDIGMNLSDIPDLSLRYKYRRSMFVSPSQFYSYFRVESDGCLFSVAYDDDNTVRAIFANARIFSDSKNFFTPEGAHIGMDYNDVLAAFPNIKFYRFPGWAYVATLPSGWKIGIEIDYQSGQNFPKQGDKIIMIYKDWML